MMCKSFNITSFHFIYNNYITTLQKSQVFKDFYYFKIREYQGGIKMSNILKVKFGKETQVYASPLYQYDYG
jgi:hypothetical protein